jgi:hypothetical protein
MNEQIEKIYGEACILYGNLSEREFCEKFAELLIQECVTKMALEIMDKQWVDDAVKNTYEHFGVEE